MFTTPMDVPHYFVHQRAISLESTYRICITRGTLHPNVSLIESSSPSASSSLEEFTAMVRARRIVVDSDDEDFPELQDLGRNREEQSRRLNFSTSQSEDVPSKGTVRRRKLGALSDKTLLRPKMDRVPSRTIFDDDGEDCVRPRRTELRITKPRPVVKSVEFDYSSGTDSMHEETFIEDFCDDDGSEFEVSRASGSDEADSLDEAPLQRSPSRSQRQGMEGRGGSKPGQSKRSPSPSAQLLAEAIEAQERNDQRPSGIEDGRSKEKTTSKKTSNSREITPSDLTKPLSKLDM